MLLEPQKNSWLLQVLTLDYLIDGYLDGDRDKNIFRLADRQVLDLRLASVQFQPASNLVSPMHAVVPWTLVNSESLVAIIPRDAASSASAAQNNTIFKKSFQGEVYIGPYLLRGKVLTVDDSVRILPIYPCFPMMDVEINCLLPGSKLVGLKAPYLLVMTLHRQLIVPAE
ncbi:MAG: hypothetical protein P4L50_15780 [Anaerolineaceae bacterium]|nr:hypothetical protein [Anaerolineaceae bacterium]